MRLSEAASSQLAHLVLTTLKKDGAKVRNERIALAQVKKSLARHLEHGAPQDQRRMR